MATILLTGATGTVGSSLAPLLKLRGHRLICLVRPKNGQSAEFRLSDILNQIDENIVVWNGDVTLPYGGVDESERRTWKGHIDKVVHCAASISFDESSAKLTSRINIDGTNNILELARELEVSEFHHLSTAYISGDADYFDEGDFDIGQTCRNTYEQTKLKSERLVRGWQYGRYSIYRLGIMVGNSITGFTPNFNGYYRPFAFFWQLRQILSERTGEKLKKYNKEGIGFDTDNALTLPLYLPCSRISTLNLIPREWAAKTLANLIELPATYRTFHIVHPEPRQVIWVTDMSLSYLGIKGYYYGKKSPYEPDSLLGNLQQKFDSSVKEYLPYIIHESKFATVNVIKALGTKYSPPPDVNRTFLTTLLKYATSVNFGRTKQPRQHKAVEV